MKPAKVPRSRRVLILVDFINPLNFPGADKLAKPALVAARATVAAARAARGPEGGGGLRQRQLRLLAVGLPRPGDAVLRARRHQRRDRAHARPRPHDITLLKPRHSAFYCTALELLLKDMGARELIVAGLSADMCVQMTAADAFLRGFEGVWVPADCTAAETPQAKAAAVKYMRDILKCDVRPARARR
ncbi:cysteine hydrolase family protein [Ramlibacter montanisoli]|uniref:cysteine hydrolase family protein n=1 Tax=Ramlibacter montanisoli TaxID=2732512 RepID=UPI00210FCDAE|nr:isochorismatase family cysteine hydrolase [Ramlibacter montanisoli]